MQPGRCKQRGEPFQNYSNDLCALLLQSTVLCPLWREGWFCSLSCFVSNVESLQYSLFKRCWAHGRTCCKWGGLPTYFYVWVLFPYICSISITNIDPNCTALVADRLRQGRSWRNEFYSRDGVLTTVKSRIFIFNVKEALKFFLPSWEGESLLESPKPAKQWVKDSIKLDGALIDMLMNLRVK